MREKKLVVLLFLLAGVFYVGSYYVLSRRGIEEAERFGTVGYYFVTPRPHSNSWHVLHLALRCLYCPLIWVDIGTHRYPAYSAPQWGLK